jgi:HD-like signal output (HDOD) protein
MRQSDHASLSALLHDVGVLVLAATHPAELQQARASTATRLSQIDIERELVGVTHGQVGAYLLGIWGFPQVVVEAVAYHENPASVSHREFGVLSAVYVADRLVHEIAPASSDPVRCGDSLDVAYLESLGVAGKLSEWRALVRDLGSASSEAVG